MEFSERVPTRELREECGVFGVYGAENAATLVLSGLQDLQHRGQDSSGIATSDGKNLYYHKEAGLVAKVYTERDMHGLPGRIAIGHDRYSTSKGFGARHAQPVFIDDVGLALAHNGNISALKPLEEFLVSKKISPTKFSDSEMIAEAIAVQMREGMPLPEAIQTTFPILVGAFSMLVMNKENLIAVRDAHGIRPLSIGTFGPKKREGYVFSSETCAFPPIGATHLRDVRPGEMVIIGEKGMQSVKLAKGSQKLDIFEFVYFARPDSSLLGRTVYTVRKNFGRELAKEHPLDVDLVMPVPQTAIQAAIGYSHETGIPYEECLIKARDRRTFIEPAQLREHGVKTKLTAVQETIQGKRVAVVDDSIVRGTTSRQIVEMVKNAGAKEVHFLVTSSPVKFPDFYGIDTPKQEELIAAHKTPEEIRQFLGADSLHYLSYEGMIRATGLPEHMFCTSCFTGEYPIQIGPRRANSKGLRIPVGV
ncbi:amidophosphoribosyltransferase [Candidatus Kaiserbacteria bacterium RIFCSPHIGHO2_01_FULL_48_10]|uniref:Amidophosphoribosyltransferase n=1 Tax=Candidatus Kaiserbacteria bacterium RIFCSPHIGHO2_01_FULL_48_10 TaxID=1798476 RepID=A0A1F6C3H2_9BACT|nr:MAG: amidophosphoribosyltransferase [Candidatus Kaiserbacteria bacterium RIFCSPHIGHO2_01_FULL_48_10]